MPKASAATPGALIKPSPGQVKMLYGYCLHLAGITDAEKLVEVMLAPANNMYFTHYVPINRFDTFAKEVVDYALDLIQQLHWAADKGKIKKPKRAQPIAEHYQSGFLAAFQTSPERR